MAIQPITFLTAGNAIAVNGSATITVTGNVDCSRIFEGSAVSLAGSGIVEGISGTTPDPVTFESTITLRYPWPDANISGRVTVFNTPEGLAESIRRVREIVANTSAIENIGTTGLLNKTGPSAYETVPITTQGRALLDDDTAADQRSTMGLGDAATKDVTTSATDTTAGRILKVGDYGLGTESAPRVIEDFSNVSLGINGLYRSNANIGDVINPPPNSPFEESVGMVLNGLGESQAVLHMLSDPNNGNHVWIGSKALAANSVTWDELWHSGNLNVTEFGGDAANDLIAVGFARSATEAVFYRELNSFTAPSSISVTDTFYISTDSAGSTALASAVVPVFTSPLSNSTLLRVSITGLSGLPVTTPPTPLVLLSTSASSKITVNF